MPSPETHGLYEEIAQIVPMIARVREQIAIIADMVDGHAVERDGLAVVTASSVVRTARENLRAIDGEIATLIEMITPLIRGG